jgi:hypothetical protein
MSGEKERWRKKKSLGDEMASRSFGVEFWFQEKYFLNGILGSFFHHLLLTLKNSYMNIKKS